MSRRHLTLLAVAIASFALSACGTSPTAPRQDDPTTPPPVTLGTSGSNG